MRTEHHIFERTIGHPKTQDLMYKVPKINENTFQNFQDTASSY